jgi:riboflavin synthase
MFTGLVQHVGTVASREETASGARFAVSVQGWGPLHEGTRSGTATRADASSRRSADAAAAPSGCDGPSLALGARVALGPSFALGESIAVNGCCLTLAGFTPPTEPSPNAAARLEFDVIHQTLRVTALGSLLAGQRVNLERSVTPATLLGGHIVQGHVDGLGRVAAILREAGEWRVRVSVPGALHRFMQDKGSVALDGVSLTVAAIDDRASTIDVCLIPETLVRTTLADRAVGDALHIEVDCLAKMVARLIGR